MTIRSIDIARGRAARARRRTLDGGKFPAIVAGIQTINKQRSSRHVNRRRDAARAQPPGAEATRDRSTGMDVVCEANIQCKDRAA